MKRLLAILLCCAMILTGCTAPAAKDSSSAASTGTESPSSSAPEQMIEIADEDPNFSELSDPDLLQYIEDDVFASLECELNSDDYIVENVTSSYISKEYLEELSYNSQENIYFGFTLSEIEAQFDGERYIFTLGENGETVVQAFEQYDSSFDQILKNVAIGSGVILICVTVSVISGGVGAPAISTVFAVSAKSGALMGLGSGALGALTAGIVTGIQTGDLEEAVTAAALEGSESFKWGAITGVITDGVGKAIELRQTTASSIPTPSEAESRAFLHYGGDKQKSYIDGVEVPWGTPGSTRPDIVRSVDGHLEAIEVKNYDLSSSSGRSSLYNKLRQQISSRVANLPEGSTQRIVLNTQGRNYSTELVDDVISNIRYTLKDIYPKIPIDIME